MKKWKYYILADLDKEAVGIVHAKNVDGAYLIASVLKHLPLEEFKKIFGIERL
jgi:hypothetical protein